MEEKFEYVLSDGKKLAVERHGPAWLWELRDGSRLLAFGQEFIAGRCASVALGDYSLDERTKAIDALEDWREENYPFDRAFHVAIYSGGDGNYVAEILVGNDANVPTVRGEFDSPQRAIECAAEVLRAWASFVTPA